MIVARELCFRVGDRPILDHICFEIARGEAVGLVGPNGSGKTSILRCLLGLVPFTGGAFVGGHDVVREPVAARAQLGYVPQKAAFGDAPALEVLTFVAKLRRLNPCRIPEVLAQVNLTAHAHERVRTFSGGMQQRLSLAVALLVDAPMLLFDEPSASLDREGQETFFDVVAQLRRRGRTMLLASHRAEEVDCLTDRVLHVDCGRIAPPSAPAARLARVIAFADGAARRPLERRGLLSPNGSVNDSDEKTSARPEEPPSVGGVSKGAFRRTSTAAGERR